MMRYYRKQIMIKVVATVIIGAIGVLMISPLLWMVSASLKTQSEIFTYPIKWIPREFRFDNYIKIFSNTYYPFHIFYVNSIKITAFSIIGMLAVSSSAAYAFAKMDFSYKNALFFIYLGTLMVPMQVTLVPRFVLFHWLGIYDTHIALILPQVFNILGIFLLRQFFITIPNELSEAAKIDGSGHLRIWLQIVMPLAKPAVISLFILGFVWNWNDYMNPLIFIKTTRLFTIPVGLFAYVEEMEFSRHNLIMAGATCAIIPLLLVFLICQRHFIEGLASTGIKG